MFNNNFEDYASQVIQHTEYSNNSDDYRLQKFEENYQDKEKYNSYKNKLKYGEYQESHYKVYQSNPKFPHRQNSQSKYLTNPRYPQQLKSPYQSKADICSNNDFPIQNQNSDNYDTQQKERLFKKQEQYQFDIPRAEFDRGYIPENYQSHYQGIYLGPGTYYDYHSSPKRYFGDQFYSNKRFFEDTLLEPRQYDHVYDKYDQYKTKPFFYKGARYSPFLQRSLYKYM